MSQFNLGNMMSSPTSRLAAKLKDRYSQKLNTNDNAPKLEGIRRWEQGKGTKMVWEKPKNDLTVNKGTASNGAHNPLGNNYNPQ